LQERLGAVLIDAPPFRAADDKERVIETARLTIDAANGSIADIKPAPQRRPGDQGRLADGKDGISFEIAVARQNLRLFRYPSKIVTVGKRNIRHVYPR
jgi:hypothetical protein